MTTAARRIGVLLAILLLGGLKPVGTLAQARVPVFQPPLRQTDAAGYRARIDALRGLVRVCREDAKLCNAAAVGDDDRVAAGGETFQVRWQWLRKLLDEAHDPAMRERSALLDEAAARLDGEFVAQDGGAKAPAEFVTARRTADSILARAEFRVVGKQSWLDRKMAQLLLWLDQFFTAAADFGHRAPWLGPVLEWSFVGLSVVGILIWVRRSLQRERLAVSLNGAQAASNWQKESAEWADLARAEAERSNWREAIHCLYWASIVALERRRLWRRDAARTPREYVELLEDHGAQQVALRSQLTSLRSQVTALRSLTRLFERIWYGLRWAGCEDYAQALALYEELRRAE